MSVIERYAKEHNEDPEEQEDGDDDENDDAEQDDEPAGEGGQGEQLEAGIIAKDGRICVSIRPNEAAMCDEVVEALAAGKAEVYAHGGSLARIVHDSDGRARIADLGEMNVRELMTRAINFQAWKPLSAAARKHAIASARPKNRKAVERDMKKAGMWKPAHPPVWLAAMIRTRREYPGVRVLEGIAEAPFLRPDGSVVDMAGYDAATRVFYAPVREYPPLPEPTVEAARAAWTEIDEVFGDFPFAAAEDHAAVLAFILTIMGRGLINGPTPGVVVEANAPRAGKGKVIETGYAIATGRELAVSPEARDDEIFRKRLTAQISAGQTVVFLDNIRYLGGPVIDALLTARRWNDRGVGDRDAVDLPMRMIVAATANGLTYEGDIAGRILPIRLRTDDPSPEKRTGFKHPLPGWAIDQHPRLHACALTILRAAMADKALPVPVWGSYESWCDVVGRAVMLATDVDPLKARADIAEQDTVLSALRQFLMRLAEKGEQTATALIGLAEPRENPEAAIRESLAVLAPSRDGRLHPRALGVALRRHRDRRVVIHGHDNSACGTLTLVSAVNGGTTSWSAEYRKLGAPDVTDVRPAEGVRIKDHRFPWQEPIKPAPAAGVEPPKDGKSNG